MVTSVAKCIDIAIGVQQLAMEIDNPDDQRHAQE
jgi:hypothetical protein